MLCHQINHTASCDQLTGGTLNSTASATAGNVSALAGIQDDSRILQMSAPVQAGNSPAIAKGFLESHDIRYESTAKGQDLSVPDVADVARSISVLVLCYK
jgi:hypothetical protein